MLFLPASVFLIACIIIYFVNQNVRKDTMRSMLPPSFISSFRPLPYPILQSNDIQKYSNSDVLSAQGAIILDNASQVVLFSKNPTNRFSLASTTKIMTALVGLEYYKPEDMITIQSRNQGAVVGFQVGERFRFVDVLYGMLLPSGNDAALSIAQNYPGGESAFVQKMNEKAKDFHLQNTHFSDSSGLDDVGDYTTVIDLVRLASLALKNPTFARIVATKQKTITNITHTKSYTLTNLNQLLGLYGVNGVKTGFTPEAGGILVTASLDNGHTLLYVVMKSVDRFSDTQKLLMGTYGYVAYVPISP